jgi:hypothetical protein
MIYGVVNLRREATLPLVISNSFGQREVIDIIIDTELILNLMASYLCPLKLSFVLGCLGEILIQQLWVMVAKPYLICSRLKLLHQTCRVRNRPMLSDLATLNPVDSDH